MTRTPTATSARRLARLEAAGLATPAATPARAASRTNFSAEGMVPDELLAGACVDVWVPDSSAVRRRHSSDEDAATAILAAAHSRFALARASWLDQSPSDRTLIAESAIPWTWPSTQALQRLARTRRGLPDGWVPAAVTGPPAYLHTDARARRSWPT